MRTLFPYTTLFRSLVVNMSWPRAEIYGTDPWGRFAALLSTGLLLGLGGVYYLAIQRRRTGILPDHAAEEIPDAGPMDLDVLAGPGGLISQFAPGE
jgi:hypothetical protein